MKARDPRSLRACSALALFGWSVYLLSFLKQHFIPNPAHAAVFNTICTLLAGAALSEAAYFSLRGLFTADSRKGSFAIIALSSAAFLMAMFWTSYYEYLIVTRTLGKVELSQLELQDDFPLISEKLNAALKTGDDEVIARAAYAVYGVRVLYHPKPGEEVYYDPPSDMRKLRRDTEEYTNALRGLRVVSKGLLYRAVDVVLVIFLSFIVCVCWSLIRQPRLGSDATG